MHRTLLSLAIVFCFAGVACAADGVIPFDKLDINGDGVLSGSEAATVKPFDTNGDGEISRQEYDAGVAALNKGGGSGGAFDQAAATADFQKRDGNQDGYLSGTELTGLEKYDSDANGRLTLEEYLTGLQSEASQNDQVEEENVVTPTGPEPFTIEYDQLVRIAGTGIAGSTIDATVLGPAKIFRKNYIQTVQNGQVLIGAFVAEFELVPTGAGKVIVEVLVTYPNDQPKKERYTFIVEPPESDNVPKS
jgi:hypothetical protein